MVVVAAERRRSGIGTALVRARMGGNPEMTWVIRAGGDGVASFYEKLGVDRTIVAMEGPGKH